MLNIEKMPGKVMRVVEHLVDMLPAVARHRLLRLVNRHIRRRPHPLALTARLRPKKKTAHSFTVVTAVYNTAPYLDDFFISLSRQSIRPDRLQIIMVDDGSTDGSARALEKWRKRLAGRVSVLRQENLGPGAARNRGLALAENEWVTFVDSDDYLSSTYFEEVEARLREYPPGAAGLVSCRQMSVYDVSGSVCDDRPFRRFFHTPESRPLNDLGDYMQMSASSAFFCLAEIRRLNLAFDERRWPCFEDAHFVLRYLRLARRDLALFCPKAVYYYRKRPANDSRVDTSINFRESYGSALAEGRLELLRSFEKVPRHVARTVWYDFSWKIKRALDSPSSLPLLTEGEKQECLALMREAAACIPAEIIQNFPEDLSGFSEFYKIGSLRLFKDVTLEPEAAVIDRYDHRRKELRLSFASVGPELPEAELRAGAGVFKPLYRKSVPGFFMGRGFAVRHRLWLPLPERPAVSFFLGGRPMRLRLGNRIADEFSAAEIAAHFRADAPRGDPEAWLFMDAARLADDNAEHLYRYVAAREPGREIYFALSRFSPHWRRLKNEGFRLVAFGGPGFIRALRRCGKILSSQGERYLLNFWPGVTRGRDFVFLQHGVTEKDNSNWFNTLPIRLLLTATEAEHQAIAADGSIYDYDVTARETRLTGFPRHDALSAPPDAPGPPILLIMPTWRRALSGHGGGVGCFASSEYARRWRSLCESETLRGLAARAGLEPFFMAHPHMRKAFGGRAARPERLQDLFKRAALMVTDYSSVAFEMAFLNKMTLYYQFDAEEVFGGGQVYSRGYFDYHRDGFGPVARTEEELLAALAMVLSGSEEAAPYLERVRRAFPRRDGLNCQRALEAIKAL